MKRDGDGRGSSAWLGASIARLTSLELGKQARQTLNPRCRGPSSTYVCMVCSSLRPVYVRVYVCRCECKRGGEGREVRL